MHRLYQHCHVLSTAPEFYVTWLYHHCTLFLAVLLAPMQCTNATSNFMALPPLLCWTTVICFIMFLGFIITTALGHLHCNMFPTLFQLHHCNSCATVPGFFLSESWQLSGVLCNLQNAQCLQIVNKLVTWCTLFFANLNYAPFFNFIAQVLESQVRGTCNNSCNPALTSCLTSIKEALLL